MEDRKTEDGGQKREDRRLTTEDGGQKTKDGRRSLSVHVEISDIDSSKLTETNNLFLVLMSGHLS